MARNLRILGISGEVCTIDVEPDETLLGLQRQLESATGIPVREQRILDGTRELQDKKAKLSDALSADSSCELTLIRRDPEQARWLEIVGADFAGNRLKNAPLHIREDREVIFAAMRRRPNAFNFMAPKLQGDRDFMLAAVRENKQALQFASRALLSDRELVLEACAHHGCAIQFASRELRSDHEIALTAAKSDTEALRFLPHELWSNRDFILAVVRDNGMALSIASAEVQADREVCLAAATSDGQALRFAAPKLLEDFSFVAEAAKVTKLALKYASKDLLGNLELVRAAVQADGGALCFATPLARAERSIVLLAVRTCAEAVAWASKELWTAEFFLEAVERNGEALWLCPPKLKGHRRWVLAAAKHTAEALRFASPELQEDPSFVLQILECGFESALQHASPSLLGDPDFVLAAARKSDSALRFATEELRADPALVRTAVNRYGCSLQYAASALRADPTVALAAMTADPSAAEFVAAELWSDRAFVTAALEECKVPPELLPEDLRSDPELVPAALRATETVESTGEAEAGAPAAAAEEGAPPQVLEGPSPKAGAAFPRRLRPKASEDANGSAEEGFGEERLDVPGLFPGPAGDRASCDAPAEGEGASAAKVGSDGHRSGTRDASENKFRMLPWCLPAASERSKPHLVIRSGLLGAALKVQASRDEPEPQQEQEQRQPEDRPPLPEQRCGPLGSIDDVKLGDHLQVLDDVAAVLGACRDAGLDFAEENWARSVGKYVKVLALDPMDGTVECRVPAVGDVWLPHAALTRVLAEVPLQTMGEAQIGNSLQVLRDTTAVLDACLGADLGSIEDETSWEASAGKVVRVIGRDCKDRAVECRVPDVGDVWFALHALKAV